MALFYALLTLKTISQQFSLFTFISTIGGADSRTLLGSSLRTQPSHRHPRVILPTRAGTTTQNFCFFFISSEVLIFFLQPRLLYSAGQRDKICHLNPFAQELEYLDSSSSSAVKAHTFQLGNDIPEHRASIDSSFISWPLVPSVK